MNSATLMLSALALPLVLAPLCLVRGARTAAFAAAPWAALPSLILAIAGQVTGLQLTPALLGMELALDTIARAFLLFTAILGLLAGWSMRAELGGDPRRFRFAAFYLAGLAGTLGVILAADVASLYTFFALMSFAVYGFVIHNQDAAAYRAGRIYIVLVVLGEGMLLAGLLLVAAAGGTSLAEAPAAVAASPHRDWIVALLLGGFGVKVGLLPLHVGLPLAYAATPVSGAVLLAGAMIKAGILGWLRLLPLGVVALPAWGGLLVSAGLTAMFYGVFVGLAQVNPKTMLAYSSISQMGFITVGLGLALLSPPLWPFVLSAVLIYAAHHAIVKGTLFLGLGVASARRGRVIAALSLPALMLAGAPFTSGAIAKFYLKNVAHLAAPPWSGTVELLLPFGALGTALLMARFLYAVWRQPAEPAPHAAPLGLVWVVALGASVSLIWFVPGVEADTLLHHWQAPRALWDETWPVIAAALIALAAIRFARGRRARRALIPPGDIVVPAERLARSILRGWRGVAQAAQRTTPAPVAAVRRRRVAAPSFLVRWQARLQYWPVAGTLFLLLVVALLFLFIP